MRDLISKFQKEKKKHIINCKYVVLKKKKENSKSERIFSIVLKAN